MLDRLKESEWTHFPQREYARALIAAGGDVLLIGGPRAGKKTFLRRLQVQCQISIECSVINTQNGVQQEFFRQLQRALPAVGPKAKLRSFEQAALALDHGAGELRVTAVFRKADHFFNTNPHAFSAFFTRYFGFALSAAQRGLHLQAILLSCIDLPLLLPRCWLPYPAPESLRAFLSEKIALAITEDARRSPPPGQDAVHARCRQQVATRAHQILARCHGFVILFRDFDTMELVARNLIALLQCDYARVANENFELKDQYIFSHCEKLFYHSPKTVYARKSVLLDIADNCDASMPMEESLRCAQAAVFDHRTGVVKTLPQLAKYLILALYICSVYHVSSHMLLVGNAKGGANRRKDPLTKWEGGLRKKVSQWRVCSMAEMLMTAPHSSSQTPDPRLEAARLGYSIEFHLCFDLLERVGLVARVARSPFELQYKMLCETKLVEKVQQDLGFMGQFLVD